MSGIVLVTDGRHTSAVEDVLKAADEASDRNVPVFTVGVGDISRERRIEIAGVYANERVWRGDPFNLQAVVKSKGYQGRSVDVSLVEKEINESGEGKVLERKTISLPGDDAQEEIEFKHEPTREGEFKYVVRIENPPDPQLEGKREDFTTVEVLSDKARVLLVAGSPTWEYRMVQVLLQRDKTMNLSCWLQSIKDMPQEGTTKIEKLPLSKADLAEYDVVLLFDPDPADFHPGGGPAVGRGAAGLFDGWRRRLVHGRTEVHGPVSDRRADDGHHGGPAGDVRRAIDFFDDRAHGAIQPAVPAERRGGERRSRDHAVRQGRQGHARPLAADAADVLELSRQGGEDGRPRAARAWRSAVLRDAKHPAAAGHRSIRRRADRLHGLQRHVAVEASWQGRRIFFEVLGPDRPLLDRRPIARDQKTRHDRAGQEQVRVRRKSRRSPRGSRRPPAIRWSSRSSSPQLMRRGERTVLADVAAQAGEGQAGRLSRAKSTPGSKAAGSTSALELAGAKPGEMVTLNSSNFEVELSDVELDNRQLNKQLLKEIAERASSQYRGKYFEVDELDDLAAALPDRTEVKTIPGRPIELWDSNRLWFMLVLLLTIEWGTRKRFKLM